MNNKTTLRLKAKSIRKQLDIEKASNILCSKLQRTKIYQKSKHIMLFYPLNEEVKTKRFELEPMTIEDAEFNLDMLGHSFYVFLNAKSGEVNILYRRADGDLGLIEVEY